MPKVTSKYLCSTSWAYRVTVIITYVVRRRSCRTFARGWYAGAFSPAMCIPRYLVLSRALPLAWSGLITFRTCQQGRRDPALRCHLHAAVSPPPGILGSAVCSSWPRRATFRSDGHAGLEYATHVSLAWLVDR